MITYEEARKIQEDAFEKLLRERAEKTAYFCETEVDAAIRVEAEKGGQSVKIHVPKELDADMVSQTLAKAGFKNRAGNGRQITIYWWKYLHREEEA